MKRIHESSVLDLRKELTKGKPSLVEKRGREEGRGESRAPSPGHHEGVEAERRHGRGDGRVLRGSVRGTILIIKGYTSSIKLHILTFTGHILTLQELSLQLKEAALQ